MLGERVGAGGGGRVAGPELQHGRAATGRRNAPLRRRPPGRADRAAGRGAAGHEPRPPGSAGTPPGSPRRRTWWSAATVLGVPVDRAGVEDAALTLLAQAVLAAAGTRTESRGCHVRTDFPARDDAVAAREQRGTPRRRGPTGRRGASPGGCGVTGAEQRRTAASLRRIGADAAPPAAKHGAGAALRPATPAPTRAGVRSRRVAGLPSAVPRTGGPDPDDLRRVVETALAEDLRYGPDATTAATVPADAVAVGGAHRPRAGRAGRAARRPRGAGRRARRRRLHGPRRPRRRRPPRRGRRRARRPRARPRPAHRRADGAEPASATSPASRPRPGPGSTPSPAPAPASATPARPCPACGCWRSTRCAAAAGSTTGSASATPC